MRVRRWALGCLTAVMSSGLAVVPAPAGAEDVATLSVPDSPSGDVVVTATADPGVAPYLQVKLVRGATIEAPYEQVDAIDPAPVANSGGAVAIDVPTWGLDGGGSNTFALLGCASADPDTCTTLLATQERSIVQLVKPTVSWDVPEQPVFWPDEDISVTADYDGGGQLLARGDFLVGIGHVHTSQALPSHGTTALTSLPADSNRGNEYASVCSELTDAYCFAYSWQTFRYVGATSLYVVRTSPRPTLISDPELSGAHLGADVYLMPGVDRLTWVVRDAEGNALDAPVEAALPPGSDTISSLDLNPVAAVGAPLPDGTYSVEFTARWTKSDRIAEATGSTTVQVLADPPVDPPEVVASQRTWRPGARRMRATPAFEVEDNGTGELPGVVRLRSPAGRVVARAYFPESGDDGLWHLDFRGFTTNDVVGLPRGQYTAELVMADGYGRRTVCELGVIHVWERDELDRRRMVSADRALVSTRGDTRTYRLGLGRLRHFDHVDFVTAGVYTPVPGEPRGRMWLRLPGSGLGWKAVDLDRGYALVQGRHVDGLNPVSVEVRISGDAVRSRIEHVWLQRYAYVWKRPSSS